MKLAFFVLVCLFLGCEPRPDPRLTVTQKEFVAAHDGTRTTLKYSFFLDRWYPATETVRVPDRWYVHARYASGVMRSYTVSKAFFDTVSEGGWVYLVAWPNEIALEPRVAAKGE